MELDKRKIGLRIKDIRFNSPNLIDHSMEELANKVGSSRSNVSRWERGINIPNAKTLKAIAELGNITVNELLYGSFEEFTKALLHDDLSTKGELWHKARDSVSKLNDIPIEEVSESQVLDFVTSQEEVINRHLILHMQSAVNSQGEYNLFDETRIKEVLDNALSVGNKLIESFDEFYNQYKEALKLIPGTSRVSNSISELDKEYIKQLNDQRYSFRKNIDEVKKHYDNNK